MKRRSQNFRTDVIRKNLQKEFDKRQKESGRPLSDAEQLDVLDGYRAKLNMAGARGRRNAKFLDPKVVASSPRLKNSPYKVVLDLEEKRPGIEAERKRFMREQEDATGNFLFDEWSPKFNFETSDISSLQAPAPQAQTPFDSNPFGDPEPDFWDLLDEAQAQGISLRDLTPEIRKRLGAGASVRKRQKMASDANKPYPAMSRIVRGSKREDREFLEQKSRQRMLDDELLEFMSRMRAAIQ